MEPELKSFYTRNENNKTFYFYDYNEKLLVKIEENNNFSEIATTNYYISQVLRNIWILLKFDQVIIDQVVIEESENSLYLKDNGFIIKCENKEFNKVDILTVKFNKELEKKEIEINNLKETMENNNNFKNKILEDFINLLGFCNTYTTNYLQVYTENKKIIPKHLREKKWFHVGNTSSSKSGCIQLMFCYGIFNNLKVPEKYLVKIHYIKNNRIHDAKNLIFNKSWTSILIDYFGSTDYSTYYGYIEFIEWPYDKPDTDELKNYFYIFHKQY